MKATGDFQEHFTNTVKSHTTSGAPSAPPTYLASSLRWSIGLCYVTSLVIYACTIHQCQAKKGAADTSKLNCETNALLWLDVGVMRLFMVQSNVIKAD